MPHRLSLFDKDNFSGEEGVLRHITRNYEPLQDLLGKPEKRTWEWACQVLSNHHNAGIPIILNLLSTVLILDGAPSAWLFTGRTGQLLRKSGRNCSVEKIKQYFCNGSESRTAIVQLKNGQTECLTLPEFKNFIDGKPVRNVSMAQAICFQRYLDPKGGLKDSTANLPLYINEYGLQMDGRLKQQSFKMGAPTSVNSEGVMMRENIRSRNTGVNHQMNQFSKAIVSCIEQTRSCRVVSLVAEYLVDINENVWLVQTKEIKISSTQTEVESKEQNDESSKTEFKIPSNIVRRNTRHNNELNIATKHYEKSLMNDIGMNGHESINEVAEKTLGNVASRQRQRNSLSTPSLIRTSDLVENPLRYLQKEAVDSHSFMPTSEDIKTSDEYGGSEIRKILSRKPYTAFRSSQNLLCPGDFCSLAFDLDCGSHNDEAASKDSRFTTYLKNTSRNKRMKTTGDQTPKFNVTYKSVALARQEKELVRLLIQRLERNLAGDYVKEFQDLAMCEISKKSPFNVYQEIKVCETCYKFYSRIDTARQNVTDKLVGEKLTEELKEYSRKSPTKTDIPLQKIDPYSDSGQEEIKKDQEVMLEQAINRANEAVKKLTKADVAEFRSFTKPPFAVIQVSEALMLLITGKILKWDVVKRVMANGERFLNMLLDFDDETIPPRRLRELEPFINDTQFRPHIIKQVCKSAASFCEWILGTVMSYHYRHGISHPRSDPLLFGDLKKVIAPKLLDDHIDPPPSEKYDEEQPSSAIMVPIPKYLQSKMQRAKGLSLMRRSPVVASSLADTLKEKRTVRNSKLDYKEHQRPTSAGSNKPSDSKRFRRPRTGEIEKYSRSKRTRVSDEINDKMSIDIDEERTLNLVDVEVDSSTELKSPKGYSIAQHRSMAGTHVAFNRHESISPPPSRSGRKSEKKPAGLSEPLTSYLKGFANDNAVIEEMNRQLEKKEMDGGDRKLTRRELRARRKIQERQMKRLHGNVLAGNPEKLETTDATDAVRSFSCSDGVTKLSFEVVGTGDVAGQVSNLVVISDFFDTYESLQILLDASLRRYPGCQALVLNYPGQAYTASKQDEDESIALNNEFVSEKIHELLQELEKSGEFVTSYRPFYVLGFGNGANIGAYFACKYGRQAEYGNSLSGLISVNGFVEVDPQLAAVLHSAVNVFSAFPPTRPDLPVSYFTRFLFSDDYLKKVDPNLVLNIYTAVTNPITLDGRIKICNGALRHKSMKEKLKDLPIPLLLLQSTENVLVNSTNVDGFLEGRTVSHLWSHQFANGQLGSKGVSQLKLSLKNKHSAFVVWIKSGHELRQEAKAQFLEVIDIILSTPPALSFESGLVPAYDKDLHTKAKPKVSTKYQAKKPNRLEDQQESVNETNNEPTSVVVAAKCEQTFDKSNSTLSVGLSSRVDVFQNKEEKERTRRVKEVESEFDVALRQHKESKRQAEEARRRRLQAIQDLENEHKKEEEEKEEKRRKASAKKMEQDKREKECREKERQKENELKKQQTQLELDKLEKERAEAEKLQKLLKESLEDSESTLSKKQKPLSKATCQVELTIQNTEQIKAACQKSRSKPISEAEKEENIIKSRIEKIKEEQQRRRKEWEDEDRRSILQLEKELEDRRRKREQEENNRWEKIETTMYNACEQPQADGSKSPAPRTDEEVFSSTDPVADTSQPDKVHRNSHTEEVRIPSESDSENDLDSKCADNMDLYMEEKIKKKREEIEGSLFDLEPEKKTSALQKMLETAEEEADTKQLGVLKMDQYEKVKEEMYQAEMKQKALEQARIEAEEQKVREAMALRLQCLARGRQGRKLFNQVSEKKRIFEEQTAVAIKLQCIVRGQLGKKMAERQRELMMRERLEGSSVRLLQRVFRGMRGRKRYRKVLRLRAAKLIQKIIRGFIGRCRVKKIRAERDRIIREGNCAMLIQATWRMRLAREQYMLKRISELAAVQIQRVYRGTRGRRRADRKRNWESAEPGPERLQLGIKLIEDSKIAFESQQEEIDALHRAQERAETRVSKIHAGLKESEKELSILEQELQDIDHLDRSLHELTHEKAELDAQPTVEEQMRKKGESMTSKQAQIAMQKRAAESYALEMAIHVKRAERERKKKELEAEFASVFHEIDTKKSELAHLENGIQDMEATRKRKEREFQRLQRNLMELLEEQKQELDTLREKGIELETATATSATAAAATAAAAKENEQRSKEMFNSTEELLKFQFMSMSLSYFSSMNMMKSLRDINSDTTQKAISSSADTAAAAAAAAQAANIPGLNHIKTNLSGGELPSVVKAKRQEKEIQKLKEIEEAQNALKKPFPNDVRKWTVEDIGRWLDTLSLSQYKKAFAEASVDGDFLMELRPEDMRDVLGMKHSLHVQKVIVTREKLRPLNEQESSRKAAVEFEDKARQARDQVDDPIPEVETLFSQIRNGRYNRVEKALDIGYEPNDTDSHGNTALIIASQNLNKRICELLLNRGAKVNHQNSQGNTAMHYAMAYDPEGALGEFLIGRGADDTLENQLGLSPYDGID